MSILDIYNNPPNNGRQIRFKDGVTPAAPGNYTPYERNDQSSLRNSQLHSDAQEPSDYGYSTTGKPNIQFANNRYYSVGEIASNLDTAQGATISDPSSGFTQDYGPGNQYASETMIQDLTTLADLGGGTERLQSLER
tara:strand:+ start:153 stop:563 length:411 start_codon:yes stop_codon:yes gene_type:complete